MHELAIAERIKEAVLEAAAVYPDGIVTSVRLTVGQLRAIEPDTLRMCWSAVTRTSRLDGSEVVISEVPASGLCRRCGAEFGAEDLMFVCPACGGVDVETRCGKELRVDSIEVT